MEAVIINYLYRNFFHGSYEEVMAMGYSSLPLFRLGDLIHFNEKGA